MKKRTAMLLALSATAAFLFFLFLQFILFAPVGVSIYPARGTQMDDVRLDLNLADASALQQLPGIGPKLSESILSWREEHGGFRSVDELLEVPGIGENTYLSIRDFVCTGGE